MVNACTLEKASRVENVADEYDKRSDDNECCCWPNRQDIVVVMIIIITMNAIVNGIDGIHWRLLTFSRRLEFVGSDDAFIRRNRIEERVICIERSEMLLLWKNIIYLLRYSVNCG